MSLCIFFSFNDPPTTKIYTLSLHDALPILTRWQPEALGFHRDDVRLRRRPHEAERNTFGHHSNEHSARSTREFRRSEEHTSELQSHSDLVCRLLLEKKKKNKTKNKTNRQDR